MQDLLTVTQLISLHGARAPRHPERTRSPARAPFLRGGPVENPQVTGGPDLAAAMGGIP